MTTILKETVLNLIAEATKHTSTITRQYESTAFINRELKTIGIRVPRRMGKTSTIKELYRPGDLIITHIDAVAKSEYSLRTNNIQYDALSISEVIRAIRTYPTLRNTKYGYIFFDEPSLMYPDLIDIVYDNLKADYFIKMGT